MIHTINQGRPIVQFLRPPSAGTSFTLKNLISTRIRACQYIYDILIIVIVHLSRVLGHNPPPPPPRTCTPRKTYPLDTYPLDPLGHKYVHYTPLGHIPPGQIPPEQIRLA